MATRTYGTVRAESMEEGDAYGTVRGSGWLAFAGVMLGLAGTWNLIDGSLALANSKIYAGHQAFVFSDLRTWGWIVLSAGILQIIAAFAIFTGSEIARWFGIFVAGVSAIGQIAFLPAYPFWALMMFSVDILVIYALAVYGGKRMREA